MDAEVGGRVQVGGYGGVWKQRQVRGRDTWKAEVGASQRKVGEGLK